MTEQKIGKVIEQDKISPAEKLQLESELDDINKEISSYQARAFSMLLEILPIIAVPAIIIIVLRRFFFDQAPGWVVAVMIVCGLIFSWYFIFKKASQLSMASAELSRKRRDIRQRLGIAPPEPKKYPDEIEVEEENL